MRLVVQRVNSAKVEVDGNNIANINKGFLVLLGVTHADTKEKADFLVKKLLNLRVFQDQDNKMNLSLQDINGELLIVSQFTLYADTKKGNRPSFIEAAKPEQANMLYEYFIKQCNNSGVEIVKHGKFGADMQISLVNDGPVTIILEK